MTAGPTLRLVAVFGDIIFRRSASRDLRTSCNQHIAFGRKFVAIYKIHFSLATKQFLLPVEHCTAAERTYPMFASPKDKCLWASRLRSFLYAGLLRSLLDLQVQTRSELYAPVVINGSQRVTPARRKCKQDAKCREAALLELSRDRSDIRAINNSVSLLLVEFFPWCCLPSTVDLGQSHAMSLRTRI